MSFLISGASGAQLDAPNISLNSASARTIRDMWPRAVVALGLGLSAAWTILLAYGFVKLIELAI